MEFKIIKPRYGLHDGSSLREMFDIWKERGLCEIEDGSAIIEKTTMFGDETKWPQSRPWVNGVGKIMLYDNPILDKIHDGLRWDFALFCNYVPKKGEVKYPFSTWTFWPNHPKAHEKQRAKGIKGYDEREHLSCFYGSYTTHLRANYAKWQPYIKCFWMGGGGNARMYSQEEYLEKLTIHKFGLCLPGVGPKCLREMELIGLGTVPIFTPGVSVDYYNPLIKDVHFLYAETPEDVKRVIDSCSKEQWEKMSAACLKWFEENASPEGVLNLTKHIIQKEFYDKQI